MMSKGIQIAFGIVFGILLITSFFNVPPSSYVINWYLNTFETNRYGVLSITIIQYFAILVLYLGVITLRTVIRRSRYKKS